MNKRKRTRDRLLDRYSHWHQHIGKSVPDVPMPEPLKKFPLWNEFVIHFTVFCDKDGKPDFRIAEEYNRIRSIRDSLCAICGESLGDVCALIGGEQSIHNRSFLDPAAHPDCAYYAALTCPFLALPNRKLAPLEKLKEFAKGKGASVMIDHQQVRPKRMALLLTSGQIPTRDANNPRTIYVQAKDTLAVDWHIMPQSQGKQSE